MWFTFQAIHNEPPCRYGEKHEVSLLVNASTLIEAQRDVRFIWGRTHTINPTPIGEPVERLNA